MTALPDENPTNYIEVVLTGGPCAGKSSSLSYLTQRLADHGIRVLTAPEIPTLIISGGISDLFRLAAERPRVYTEIESQILLMQRAFRRQYQAMAQAFAPDPVVVIYDRAEMDIRAYLDDEHFFALLDEAGLTLEQVRDSYDLVIHMVSAANGAEEHYTDENNAARQESVEEARGADRRTMRAWLGHPHLKIVDNSTDFEGKLARTLDCVNHLLGTQTVEIERKFLLAEPPDLASPELTEAQAISIEQTYLRTDEPDVEMRVRKRSQNGQTSYFWTRKAPLASGGREEREALIRPSEYLHLLEQADPARRPIRKTRYCFPSGPSYCELDRIERPGGAPLWILEIELLHIDEPVHIPDFLSIEREVTDERAFTNAELANP